MLGSLVPLVIFGLLWVYPFWRLLPKFGISSWFALASFVPFGILVLIWVVAFREPVVGPSRAELEDRFE